MSLNKLALLRYRIIDSCLQNRFRKWTLEDLMEKVDEGLYEYEGITSGVSRRTIQTDLQNMRSDKLGYNAPIVVVEKKYYQYGDALYSISNSKLSTQDIGKLNDVVKVLKQFRGFSYFEDLSEMISKLEDKILRQSDRQSLIDFEKNDLVAGVQWIEILHTFMKKKTALTITYQSFRAQSPSDIIFHAYLLKEYRNRWFVLGKVELKRRNDVRILALDRIKHIAEHQEKPFVEADDLNVEHYFDDVIGVTKSPRQPTHTVILEFDAENTPYVLTKPLHSSQKILRQLDGKLIISIEVVLNFELEREILGFGESVKVLSPRLLKNHIISRLQQSVAQYETPSKSNQSASVSV